MPEALIVTAPVVVSLLVPAIRSSPPLIVVPPVKVDALARPMTPTPFFVSPPEPEITVVLRIELSVLETVLSIKPPPLSVIVVSPSKNVLFEALFVRSVPPLSVSTDPAVVENDKCVASFVTSVAPELTLMALALSVIVPEKVSVPSSIMRPAAVALPVIVILPVPSVPAEKIATSPVPIVLVGLFPFMLLFQLLDVVSQTPPVLPLPAVLPLRSQ